MEHVPKQLLVEGNWDLMWVLLVNLKLPIFDIYIYGDLTKDNLWIIYDNIVIKLPIADD